MVTMDPNLDYAFIVAFIVIFGKINYTKMLNCTGMTGLSALI